MREDAKPIAIGADDAGLPLKPPIIEELEAQGYAVVDFGVNPTECADYPDVAFAVAESIRRGACDRAILLCGTGIGMAIAANKVKGIRAAPAHDTYSAERARMSNDAQILTLGARVIGPELAKKIVSVWMHADFAGGRSAPKLRKIEAYENRTEDRWRSLA